MKLGWAYISISLIKIESDNYTPIFAFLTCTKQSVIINDKNLYVFQLVCMDTSVKKLYAMQSQFAYYSFQNLFIPIVQKI